MGSPRDRKERFETGSGIPLEGVYGSDGGRPAASMPGSYPFTRGIHPTMYRGRLWTMRQYAGFGSAKETNGRFRYLLGQGQTGLSTAFDLPTQLGYDSDHPRAAGEVGRVGVAISSLSDMEELFGSIPLDRVSTSMTINATAPILLALYVAVADRTGVPRAALSGTVQNDILKEFVARGNFVYPVAPSLRLAVDVMEFCAKELPSWNAISISGYHMREAGATAVQELAFTFAHALAYLEAARDRRLDLARIASKASFFFGCHNDLLEEVAKFRAARSLWADLARVRLGIADEDACKLRFHTQTCGSTLTSQQPDNNVVRVALQALAAVLGGTQSLHTNSRDEALGLPSEASALLALRTQQILAHETGVADVADPLGGSYLVERLTHELGVRARALMAEVEKRGGALAAIASGWTQREIQESAYRAQREIEEGRRILVGVNEFRDGAEAVAASALRVDARIETVRKKSLARLRKGRDAKAVRTALAAVVQAARGATNVLPSILAAVKVYATVGEISDAMRTVFGEHKETRTV